MGPRRPSRGDEERRVLAGRPAAPRQITIRYLTDQQTALNALTAGEADFHLRVRPESVEQLERVDGINVVSSPSLWLEDCYFNFSRPPFDDARSATP